MYIPMSFKQKNEKLIYIPNPLNTANMSMDLI